MKKKIIHVIMHLLMVSCLIACTENHQFKIEVLEDESLGFQNPDICFDIKDHVFVPDKETAAKIAVAVWSPIYGEETICNESPYRAKLVNDSIWIVEGSFNESSTFKSLLMKDKQLGGSAYVEIRKSDGKILRMIHGE